MTIGKKRVRGTFAASILLAASLASAPAIAKKPPPPPPPVEDPDDPWASCTPYGSYDYFADCCDYPELVVPCESQSVDPSLRREDVSSPSTGE